MKTSIEEFNKEAAQRFIADPEGFPKEELYRVQAFIDGVSSALTEIASTVSSTLGVPVEDIDWNGLTRVLARNAP